MDSILAAVGYKPSDRVQLTHEPENKDKPLPKDAIDKAASISFPYSLPVPSSQTPAQSEPTAPTAADTGDNKEGEIVDCISCRIIGGSTLIGTGAYTYYWANRIAMTQTKTRRRIYRIQGAMFASSKCNLTNKDPVFYPLGLSGRRGIVVACVRPSVCLSVCLSVRP